MLFIYVQTHPPSSLVSSPLSLRPLPLLRHMYVYVGSEIHIHHPMHLKWQVGQSRLLWLIDCDEMVKRRLVMARMLSWHRPASGEPSSTTLSPPTASELLDRCRHDQTTDAISNLYEELIWVAGLAGLVVGGHNAWIVVERRCIWLWCAWWFECKWKRQLNEMLALHKSTDNEYSVVPI